MTNSEIWLAWTTLMEGTLEPIEVVRVAAMYERYFQEVQRQATMVARAEGRSWEEIGAAVGTTRQAAWQRFRRPDHEPTRAAEPARPAPPAPPATGYGEFAVAMPRGPADVFAPMVTAIVDSIVWDDAPMRTELLEAGQRALVEAIESHPTTPQRVPFTVYASARVRQVVTDEFLAALDRDRRRRG